MKWDKENIGTKEQINCQISIPIIPRLRISIALLKYLISMLLVLTFIGAPSFANDIYITQSGDNLDLDITQDGQDNEFGDSTTDASLTGDLMTFSITQTGNFNKIDIEIEVV